MRFWDTSAIVPLLVAESGTRAVTAELERDPEIAAWWGTRVECVSAIARLERDRDLEGASVGIAIGRLDVLTSWREVQPVAHIRETAIRLLRVHPLRAADAMQLAAAILVAEDDPRSLPFVTLDDRLARAAEREGFPVVEPGVGGG